MIIAMAAVMALNIGKIILNRGRASSMTNKTITIPFSDEQLDEYLNTLEDDKSKIFYKINYKKSQYKGSRLLNYIYNSSLTCDLINFD